MSTPQMETWLRVREIGCDLSDCLALARGPSRLELAKLAVRDARLALEAITGPEAEAARTAFAALEAAHREIAP